MRTAATLVLAVCLLQAPAAHASYFEYCRLTGFLVSPPAKKKDTVTFRLYVRAACPAVCGIATSYDPEVCSTYVGKTLSVGLPTEKAQHLALKSDVEMIQIRWLETTGRMGVAWRSADSCE